MADTTLGGSGWTGKEDDEDAAVTPNLLVLKSAKRVPDAPRPECGAPEQALWFPFHRWRNEDNRYGLHSAGGSGSSGPRPHVLWDVPKLRAQTTPELQWGGKEAGPSLRYCYMAGRRANAVPCFNLSKSSGGVGVGYTTLKDQP